MLKAGRRLSALAGFLLLGAAAASAYGIFFTTPGARWIAGLAIQRSGLKPYLQIDRLSGSFAKTLSAHGIRFTPKDLPAVRFSAETLKVDFLHAKPMGAVTLEDFEAEGLPRLPAGALVKIQSILLMFPYRLQNVRELTNGRLALPSSDPIFFFGRYHHPALDFQIYSKKVNVREVLDVLGVKGLRLLSGSVTDAELFVKGNWPSPRLRGKLRGERLQYRRFLVENARTAFALACLKNGHEVRGTVLLKKAKLTTRNVSIDVWGNIRLSGDWRFPALDLKGSSRVEDTLIHLSLGGTLAKPQLVLTSDPVMSQEQLLIMLATGRGWKGTGEALRQGRLSADVAKEFVDYFLLGGSGTRLAQLLGIKEISLQYDEEAKGMEVKKDVFKNVDAIVGVEQPQPAVHAAKPSATQKVGAEVRIGRDASVAVRGKKELKASDETGDATHETQARESVTVEYKKKF